MKMIGDPSYRYRFRIAEVLRSGACRVTQTNSEDDARSLVDRAYREKRDLRCYSRDADGDEYESGAVWHNDGNWTWFTEF